MKILLSLMLLAIFALSSCETDDAQIKNELKQTSIVKEWRIVSLNGTITELLYEFNLGDQIVGVDVTSTHPAAAKEQTNLGHATKLNAEAILALKPNLILIDEKKQNNDVLETLKASGIEIQIITIPQDLSGAVVAAQQLGKVLGQEVDTKTLEEKITKNKKGIQALTANQTNAPKVLFIYARGAQMLMVAGKNTFAEKMIQIAGGTHIINEFESFKPLTPEALLTYQPDVLLMFNSGLASLGNEEEQLAANDVLWSIPGIEKVPAGKNKRVITMDGLQLSGFGPRSSDAALDLASQLHQPQ